MLTAPPAAWPRLFALALGLDARAQRGADGTDGWSAIFSTSFEAKNEYLPGLPALQYGREVFLDRFAETVPALPVNVAGHPPGLLLTLDALGLTTAGADGGALHRLRSGARAR